MKDSPAPKSARILMVDDNGMGLVARKSVLAEYGHQIGIASTPEEALEQFAKHAFDIVVTDFRMPTMNGIELIVRLRKIRATIPVILISGFTDALGLDEDSTGADVVIQKGQHEVTQLIRAVSRLLRRPPRRMPPRSQGPASPAAARKHSK